MNKAIYLFKQPNPSTRGDAVEKLWDAFERLKTYHVTFNKKDSAEKIITAMSSESPDFKQLFESEFKALTDIGNNFRIRHHETGKVNITDNRHYDYLFKRCLSLVSSALQYLE